MSFLDIMACGFGALVLILLISEFNEVEIIENKYTADLFLTKQEEIVTKTNELNEFDNELTSKLKNLISIQEELDKVKENLNERTNIAESLTETSQLKQSQIIVKKADQKQPEKQVVASGIRIDSRYLIFI